MKTGSLFLALLTAAGLTATAQPVGTCPRSQGEAYLDAGNVRARILNNGALFFRGYPFSYEVPKGSGIHGILASSLWVGGRIGDSVRTAATLFGEWEFWPGPLDDAGLPPAEILGWLPNRMIAEAFASYPSSKPTLPMNSLLPSATLLLALFLVACEAPEDMPEEPDATTAEMTSPDAEALLAKYISVTLQADLSVLTERERRMIPLLIEAAQAMDEIFWMQAYGDRDSLLSAIDDAGLQRFAAINYGPWDRLDGNAPFIEGVGPKPEGANLYPADMTDAEFEAAAAANPQLKSLYTMVRRDDAGNLVAIPYHEYFAEPMQRAAAKLRQAATLADEGGLRRYLELRADALLSGTYQPSDLAWMDMKDNTIDVVIGPIETYEDQRYGYKAAAETYVLIKDQAWSQRLARYAELLPALQDGLPVPDDYKQETPGSDSDLGAYDAIYYAGDCNAGSKTIAINLPNDEQVQLQKGTRRLQLKNAMQAKFDKILVPIADVLLAEDQRPHISFDAFFGNTMFHEVAHGLGIKNTITGQGTVREALREHASALEEGKADVLGLYMVSSLHEAGEWDADLMDHYVTFFTSIFRSIRFGLSSAHGRANLIRFNYFHERGAFSRDAATGAYRINIEAMQQAADDLSEQILRLQGDGDYDQVAAFVAQYLVIGPQLQAGLDRLAEQGIPNDIIFEQGLSVLGLQPTTSP